MQEWSVRETWLNAGCELAEGPYYEKSTDSLRFIDIKKKQVRWVRNVSAPEARTSVDASAVETLQLDAAPGVTADIKGVDPTQKILVGLKHGLGILDVKTGKYDMIKTFEDGKSNERLRANDGAADPHGHFWLGTMTDFGHGPFQPEGPSFESPPLIAPSYITFLSRLPLPLHRRRNPYHRDRGRHHPQRHRLQPGPQDNVLYALAHPRSICL